jgi:hypothetical protein
MKQNWSGLVLLVVVGVLVGTPRCVAQSIVFIGLTAGKPRLERFVRSFRLIEGGADGKALSSSRRTRVTG